MGRRQDCLSSARCPRSDARLSATTNQKTPFHSITVSLGLVRFLGNSPLSAGPIEIVYRIQESLISVLLGLRSKTSESTI